GAWFGHMEPERDGDRTPHVVLTPHRCAGPSPLWPSDPQVGSRYSTEQEGAVLSGYPRLEPRWSPRPCIAAPVSLPLRARALPGTVILVLPVAIVVLLVDQAVRDVDREQPAVDLSAGRRHASIQDGLNGKPEANVGV